MPQEDESRRAREGRFAGLRLVGIFVPWQAVVLVLAVVVALAGLAGIRWAGGGDTRVHLASTDESTTTTTSGDTSTTTTSVAPATTTTKVPSTSTTGPAKVAAPKATTTTTVPPPATCAVIRSTVTGSASSSWVPSSTIPGTWDRHITTTVTNPMNQPVVLGYIATTSSVTSYLVQLAGSDGRRLGAGESTSVDATFHYTGDHTAWGYSPPPDKLYSVEFTPVSAPDLFCRSDLDHPGETQGAKPHPAEPFVYVAGHPSLEEGDGSTISVHLNANGVFPGLRVRYRMLMKDDTLQEFTADLPLDFQGVGTMTTVPHPRRDLKDFGTTSGSGHIPWFQGITTIEWNGTAKPCTSAMTNACAPSDGSLLEHLP